MDQILQNIEALKKLLSLKISSRETEEILIEISILESEYNDLLVKSRMVTNTCN
jgi:hypothetical protein